ncbi:MAG: VWA domain-containing protein, partial [Vicinamibacterales bacterium]
MSTFLHNLLVFGRLLKRRGVDVHVGRVLDVAGALQHVDLGVREDVFHTCRALLVHRHDDLPVFDAAFDTFWTLEEAQGKPKGLPPRGGPRGGPRDGPRDGPPTGGGKPLGLPDSPDSSSPPTDESGSSGPPEALRTWSGADVLAGKDFAEFTPEEVAMAQRVLDDLEWNPGVRRTRRWVPGRGPRVDLRRALARSLRTGGDVLVLPRRKRRTRPRPVVLLCDVSGSMERYSRMLLHFAHALSKRHRRVEAFLFSTQLTRITRQLRLRRIDQAVAAVAKAVPDWSGGTRIGEAIRTFHQHWSRRALRGGPVVLLVSDGW